MTDKKLTDRERGQWWAMNKIEGGWMAMVVYVFFIEWWFVPLNRAAIDAAMKAERTRNPKENP